MLFVYSFIHSFMCVDQPIIIRGCSRTYVRANVTPRHTQLTWHWDAMLMLSGATQYPRATALHPDATT